MRTYTVYCHTNLQTGQKYYGMTSQKPHRRWGRGGNKYHSNKEFRAAIDMCGWDGFDHEVLAVGLPFDEALHMERFLIARDRTDNPAHGYNRRAAEHARRPEYYARISAAKMGHPVSSATRGKLRAAADRKPVAQVASSGEILRVFPSLTDAARAVNIHKGRICAVCRGRQRTSRGFFWRYATPEASRANS